MRKYEFQGKTVEKAIDEGLKELGVSQFDVDIKILESGGLFKKARVEITINDDEEVSFKDAVKEEVKKAVESVEPKHEEPKEEKHEPKVEAKEKIQPTEVVVEPVEEVVKPVEEQDEQINKIKEETEQTEVVEQNEEMPAKHERVYADNKGTKQFLEGLFEKLGIEAEVEIVEEDEHTKAFVSTEKAGLVIGHRGEMLSAIQYLANIVEQKTNRYAKRVVVDVANYRENRDDSLKDLADRMARKVLKYHKSVKLNPMNAYDRRIVHTYLQNFKGVTTHSVGTEPRRCLVIDLDRN